MVRRGEWGHFLAMKKRRGSFCWRLDRRAHLVSVASRRAPYTTLQRQQHINHHHQPHINHHNNNHTSTTHAPRVVHDLNKDPSLPFPDASFDAVTCAVSVDYLTKPLEVFREIHRVLKPGGRAAMSFSNRCFPTKAVAVWTATGDEGEGHVCVGLGCPVRCSGPRAAVPAGPPPPAAFLTAYVRATRSV